MELDRLFRDIKENKNYVATKTEQEKFDYLKKHRNYVTRGSFSHALQKVKYDFKQILSNFEEKTVKLFVSLKREIREFFFKFLTKKRNQDRSYCHCKGFQRFIDHEIKRFEKNKKRYTIRAIKQTIMNEIPLKYHGSRLEETMIKKVGRSLYDFKDFIEKRKQLSEEKCSRKCEGQ